MPNRRQQKSIWPLVLVIVGVALIGGALIWAASLPPEEGPLPEPTAGIAIPFPEVPRVSLADARAAYETNAAVFVDVRGEPFYSERHITGALSIPEEDLPAGLDALEPTDWIIPYCT